MRELGFAIVGAVVLIALGLYALNSPDSSDFSTVVGDAEPSASSTQATSTVD